MSVWVILGDFGLPPRRTEGCSLQSAGCSLQTAWILGSAEWQFRNDVSG